MEPRERAMQRGDLRLQCLEWGDTTAPPVVLLHGLAGHARTWDHVAEAMAARFRILALDQRGHGESGWAPDGDYRASTMAADLAAVVEALALPRFSLVGQSMGARVAIVFAAAHPGRVERLVLVDMGPEIAPEGLRRIRTTVSQAPEELDSEEEAYRLLRAAAPRYREPLLRHRVRHSLAPLPNGKLTWKHDKVLRDRAREGNRDIPSLWPELARITCPTLIVRGGESDVLSPQIAARMLDVLPEGRLVEIPGAGHTVPGDQPEAFIQAVLAFLSPPPPESSKPETRGP
ncbi:MAG: alpha/beta fold hydrolase [Candidatus Rokubacteria bacterium]|nr:alpha/beta fold hydrolase [Candidatus Rokubacteria bacterium]